MNRLASQRVFTVYCCLAGTCDATTGILLVVAPSFVLQLMGITTLPTELIYLRFIGTFVGCVGLLYLYPFLGSLSAAGATLSRSQRLVVVLEATTLIRAGVALFVGTSIALGALSLPWLSVALTDFIVAAIQILLLRRFVSHS